VSAEVAAEHYGVVVNPGTFAVDDVETRKRRGRHASA
jgi:hypothetical protein